MNAQNVAIQCRQEGGEKVMGRKKKSNAGKKGWHLH